MICDRLIRVIPFATFLAALVAALGPNQRLAADDPAAHPSVQANLPTVCILSWAQTEEFIRKTHVGKVVLVDIWTRTCPPCVEGFPDFVRLQERFGRDKFACISVNCDYDGIEGKPPEYYQARVEKFLREQNARFDHVLLNVPLLDFLDEVRLSSTPAMFVYNPAGKLVRRFDNDDVETEADEFKIGNVAAAVEMLLKSSAESKTDSD